ncbi:GNAT family N-acetyltransferase [Taylorella equigenitalis]|uniref:GNAT family N-acetyltransferase n=1 Tax=Taylorella equigenitalis TaxID=29575 RepID=UPI00237C9418|nr:GNAT family N-acetyltransferase [Taylorella equigenitalis]WDU55241.1 GNAT family N-acetyltransferase [Taylorella equigenitalis]
MKLRNAQIEDLDSILDLQHIVYPEYLHESRETFQSRISHSPQNCWVVEDDKGIICAYLLAIIEDICNIPSLGQVIKKSTLADWNEAQNAGQTKAQNAGQIVLFLHDMVVSPDCRGQGISTMLLDHELAVSHSQGVSEAYLVAVQGADRLWARYGFNLIDGNALAFDLSSYGPTAKLMHMHISPHK